MFLDAEAAAHLRPWLVRTLEPICDAEPGALADYILALLKHNAPEADLRQELTSQLEEFLEKETSSFIQTLFTALRTKSYLPYVATSPPEASSGPSTNASMDIGIPIPLDLVTPSEHISPDRGRKRSLDQEDQDYRAPKGPRLNEDGNFQRYGRPDRGSWTRGERGGRMMISGRADYMDGGIDPSMEMTGGMNGRGYRPPDRVRGICRDYHNNGYCARGAFCKYSHGEDAVIPGPIFPMNGMPGYNPMVPFPMGVPNPAQYNPHERMDMRPMAGGIMGVPNGKVPHQRAPLLHRDAEVNGSLLRKPGELPVIQDLTPRLPPDEQSADGPGPGLPVPMQQDRPSLPEMVAPPMQMQDVEMSLPPNPMAGQRNGGFRQHRGGPRGTFADAASFRPERRNDKTLVVEKIPEDKLSLGSINDWFKKFGTVTNVAVDPSTSKALVSFAEHQEAFKAWKSEDAVFGNRFVKVFWHRPMEGHGQKGTRLLAASADLVAKVATKDAVPPPQPSTSTPMDVSRPSPSPAPRKATTSTSSTVSALAAKQQLLEQQIAEQKSLMSMLSTASAEDKKKIMGRLRKLNEEMKPGASPAPKAEPSTPSIPAAPGKASRGSTPRIDDREAKERERLDKELEIHSVVTSTEVEGEESTDELKARLAKLKAEASLPGMLAASLGIGESAADGAAPYAGSGYRPYRGRGRGGGRSFYRGAMRGGPPRASMKLDNRPKKLLVKGASSDQLQGVRDWYETVGQVEAVDTTDDGDILVSFRSRAAAEQGLAKGPNLPIVGTVQVSWYTGQAPAPTTKPSNPSTNGTPQPKDAPAERAPSPVVSHDDINVHEDEVIVGGWGADDTEDGFMM
ncbi:hypothetical protein BDW22DRAFT_1412548 [Trametopsis cervina]|nr:hypothetical protein BDW22DRAFT_1412548 [Trametopsis cervina]